MKQYKILLLLKKLFNPKYKGCWDEIGGFSVMHHCREDLYAVKFSKDGIDLFTIVNSLCKDKEVAQIISSDCIIYSKYLYAIYKRLRCVKLREYYNIEKVKKEEEKARLRVKKEKILDLIFENNY